MWTASLKEKRENYNNIDFVVTFTDGTDSFNKVYKQEKGRVSVESVKDQVRRQLYDLNNPVDLPVGEIDLTEATPTAAQIARNEFEDNYRKLQAAQRGIDLGIIPADAAAVTNLRTKVANDFKKEYLDIL